MWQDSIEITELPSWEISGSIDGTKWGEVFQHYLDIYTLKDVQTSYELKDNR